MKKILKRLSVLALAALSCFALCACSVKEMREAQAFYGQDETEVIYNGQHYKLIGGYEDFPIELEINTNGWGYITEKDVPVLLSQIIGDDMYYNYSKTIIHKDYSSYYVRDDVYDYVENLMEYPYLDKYCVEVDDEFSYNPSYELVRERYISAIEEITQTGEAISLDDESYAETSIKDHASIYNCDEKMIFQRLAFSIEERESGNMYLIDYNFDYEYEDTYYESSRRILIPDDKKAMMKELLTLGEDGLR